MSNNSLTQRPAFAALKNHHAEISKTRLKDMFSADPERFQKFHVKQSGLLFDYSKRHVDGKTLKLLLALARACDVEKHRDDMFAGEVVNLTEARPVLHTALRGQVDEKLSTDGENVSAFVKETLKRMKDFVEKIRDDGVYTDIVNIGIGGSDLGARIACEALETFADGPRIHFVSNIDSADIAATLKKLNPEKVLFIVVSKTFSTLETLANAKAAWDWLEKRHQNPENQFIAITENIRAAETFGIRADNIFPMRPWIGGRYSVWSAAGLPLAIGIGFDNFRKFLDGAGAVDAHFKTAPLEKNIPVLMALLEIWERNFFDMRTRAVIPYAYNLRNFHLWLQQVEMESSGKSVDQQGRALDYATGPAIFGYQGTDAQHAFFQSLHQGTDIIPCEFILAAKGRDEIPGRRILLNANALAQAQALMTGQENMLEPHKNYPGGRPSSTLIMDILDPRHLGMLMALYEHKVFAQGVIWNIDSFDQWGVELGKTLSKDIAQALEKNTETKHFDSSTAGLVRHLKE